ncbi:uncharacterized protein TNCV_2560951 [Trichonephila clavipes]|uniref:Transposase Tc1-like domain-containing protein n=1 Tax=Trichonephila clavipes TaxID=2585209 RepID=A0A8X6R0P1_TRICX|nr:uncharacterized protein TNCV_2560951 [Trichonephila clavipes]
MVKNPWVKVMDSWSACLEFKPNTTEDSSCKGTMHVKSVEAQKRWVGLEVNRGGLAQASSSSLEHGSKLRGPSPEALEEISQLVGQKQVNVMWICHHWMQKEMTDQRDQSHPSRCTTVRDDKQIVCMTEMDRVATSRAIAQQIQSVTHHSVSTHTIRRHLQ